VERRVLRKGYRRAARNARRDRLALRVTGPRAPTRPPLAALRACGMARPKAARMGAAPRRMQAVPPPVPLHQNPPKGRSIKAPPPDDRTFCSHSRVIAVAQTLFSSNNRIAGSRAQAFNIPFPHLYFQEDRFEDAHNVGNGTTENGIYPADRADDLCSLCRGVKDEPALWGAS
jgi:hypothetical protein